MTGDAHHIGPLERLLPPIMEQLALTKEQRAASKEQLAANKEQLAVSKETNFLLRHQAKARFRYTTSQATQHRSPGFRKALIEVRPP